ncbi:MAG: hypothetical protein SFW07_05830 [Gammaproteobacteria bacterium]|nr:hypothetical protein [Gammaproteobacteria bacterium]
MSHEDKSRKRDREVDVESTPSVPALEDFYSRIQEILLDIREFNAKYVVCEARIHAASHTDLQRQAEAKIRMFTLETPSNHHIIEMLQLFYQQSSVLAEAYAMNTEISHILKSADMDKFGVDRQELIQFREMLCNHIGLVGQRANVLVNFYRDSKDSYFKADIQRRLQEYPELIRWVQPFLDAEPGADPLLTAVTRNAEDELKRRKHDEVEIIMGAFEADVCSQLEELEKKFNQHCDTVEAYDDDFEIVATKSYLEKVEFYASYSTTVLKEIVNTIKMLRLMVGRTDHYIREILKRTSPLVPERPVKIQQVLQSWSDSLSDDVNSMYELIERLIKDYPDSHNILSPKLFAFIKPRIDKPQNYSLESLIASYESFQETTDAHEGANEVIEPQQNLSPRW